MHRLHGDLAGVCRGLDADCDGTEARGVERLAPGPPEQQIPDPGLDEPMDVGYAVLFLASDEAKFVNGAELRVDNGSVINPAVL
ncbi:MAG: SDR family oxidoreductase [Gammaproteobacteria bacterium]|nr:SDR family oxidoreductase [Gammaproteobacteria bacterium]MBT3868397.1 SDR family oxidoreductase [Gammaproteobacteria bacterium]MBT4381504.1 SDR family oxidoreductase [Gammaproteobacteria bacterium]MBT4615078.1 SDR family oxidoreductase [Gammaproteobacteria bacterium]MBT5196367.1 SDR family oxidoreductase [Gammaproteobacteria bacterium]